jgi:HEAT repeat protein
MNAWRTHLAWAVATPLLAASWGRWTLAQSEAEFESRARVARTQAVDAGPGASSPPEVPAASAPAREARKGAPLGILSEEEAFVDSIRLGFRSSRREDWNEAARRMDRIPKGPVKIDLYRDMLACKDPNACYIAVIFLDELLGPDSMPLLQGVLSSDREAWVRTRAADLVGKYPDPSSLAPLLQAFRDPDLGLQTSAASALNRLGQKGPSEELLPRLAAGLDDPDGAVRLVAVGRINSLEIPSAIPYLLRCLRDTDGDVRQEAVRGLGGQDDPGVESSLEALLKDPDSNVSNAAEYALLRYRAGQPKK